MEGDAAVTAHQSAVGIQAVDLSGHIVKAFGPQEKAVFCPVWAPYQLEVLGQRRMGLLGGKVEIAAAAFRVEAPSHGNGLQQGGFAAAVFPHQKSDRLVKFQSVQPLYQGQMGHIAIEAVDLRLFADGAQVEVPWFHGFLLCLGRIRLSGAVFPR